MQLSLRNILHLLFITAVMFSLSCSREPEEEVLRRIVKEVAEASEKKDIKAITKHISESYNDFQGNDYKGIKRLLLYHFLRAEKITVFLRGVDVKFEEHETVVDARVVLVRGKEVKSIGDILPEEAAAYGFNVIFKKEGGDWKAVSARWENIGLKGLLG